MVLIANIVDTPPDFDENVLDGEISRPRSKDWQPRGVYFTISLVDERKINARDELNFGRFFRVSFATGDPEAVDAVLMHSL